MIASEKKILTMTGTVLYLALFFFKKDIFFRLGQEAGFRFLLPIIYDSISLFFGILFLFIPFFSHFYEKYNFVINRINFLFCLSVTFNVMRVVPVEKRFYCFIILAPSVLPLCWFADE